MFSGQVITTKKWLVLVAIAALAAFVIACGTDETKTVSNGNDGVGAQPTQDVPVSGDPDDDVDTPPADPGYEVVEVLAPIESVQILILESFPEQYVVQVVSGLPSGCATYSHNVVSRDGTTINIEIYNTVPAPDQLIVCTAIYGIHDENISLGSDFDRGVEYTVLVNGNPGAYFTTMTAGSSELPPVGDDPGFVVEPAPIESIEVVMDGDLSSDATYYANITWGLSNGCKESIEPNVILNRDNTIEIYALVKVPTGDVMCTDDYRVDSAKVLLGVIGEELIPCVVYTINAGREVVEFQAIAPNMFCARPEITPTPEPPTGGGSIISDQQALTFTLEAKDADVEYGGQAKFNEMFGLYPTELKVNGQQVLVYEFAPGSSAEKASEGVSRDGTSIVNPDGTVVSAMWVAPPHFYLYGNAIILYIGNDSEMGELLSSVAGQFAGSVFSDGADEVDDEFTTRLAQIENVSIASTRSIPAQHLIGVTIALSGSCETFKSIDWTVEGHEVLVPVTTQVPTAPVPCTLAIIYEDQSINIGSDFEAGVEYTVIVNGDARATFFGG